MRHLVDIRKVAFTATMNPTEKLDQNGKQKINRDGALMWATQVMALDDTGAEVLTITVAGVKPNVTVGQMVIPVELEAIPWSNNGKHGIAYRAVELRPATASASK
jgi:hypothetical protein